VGHAEEDPAEVWSNALGVHLLVYIPLIATFDSFRIVSRNSKMPSVGTALQLLN
jgi:hypothetical protein